MFWSWIAIAILSLILALLTGRIGALIIGVGAVLAALLDHWGQPTYQQWLVAAAATFWVILGSWRQRRR